MAFDLRDLEYFVVVAKHGNLRRAADVLNLSQPALSKSMRRLEERVDVKLFKRIPKGVELTDTGAALLAHVAQLRLSLDDINRELADIRHGHSGHLRVGAAPGTSEPHVPTACRVILSEAPRVTIDITAAANDVLLPSLGAGQLDLIVSGIPTSTEDLAHEHLFDDEFVVIASGNHRLAKRKKVSINDVAKERWASHGHDVLSMKWLLRAFETYCLPPPHFALTVTHAAFRYPVVATTDLVSIATRRWLKRFSREHNLTEIPVKELVWRRPVGVSYRKHAYLSPAAKRFIEILKHTAKFSDAERP